MVIPYASGEVYIQNFIIPQLHEALGQRTTIHQLTNYLGTTSASQVSTLSSSLAYSIFPGIIGGLMCAQIIKMRKVNTNIESIVIEFFIVKKMAFIRELELLLTNSSLISKMNKGKTNAFACTK